MRLQHIGKLKPGIPRQQAQAEMDRLPAPCAMIFPMFYPANGGLTFGIVTLLTSVANVRGRCYFARPWDACW